MREITKRVVLGIGKLARRWWGLGTLILVSAYVTWDALTTKEPGMLVTMGWCWGLLMATFAMALMMKWKD